jgi:hypothetical protein
MLETTAGTAVYPTAAAGKSIVLSGNANFSQTASFTDSSEARNSRSAKSRFQDLTPAGTWSFSSFIRPSGTAGTAPDANHLFRCCFGTESIVAGSSVTYTPAVALETMTMLFKYQDVAFGLVGATVNELRMSLTNKGAINCSWSGGFMQMLQAGSTNGCTATAAASWIVMPAATDTQKYSVGMRLEVYNAGGSYTHAGSASTGYIIGSITTTSIYVTPAIQSTIVAADTVRPWIPTIAEVGYPVECRTGVCEFDDVAVTLMGMEAAFTNNIRYLEDEITTSGYPSAFAADNRKITGSTSIYLRGEDLHYFYKARNNTNVKIEMIGGTVAGKIFTLTMPYCNFSVPPIAGEMEKQLSLEFQALGSAGEDEVSLKFA